MEPRSKFRLVSITAVGMCLFLLPGVSSSSDKESATVPALECPPCDDGDACTVDSCDASSGTCVHAPRVCDDQNSCTSDSCDPATGCAFTPLPAETVGDDGNACTRGDSCDAGGHCAGTPEPSGAACDDGNACTLSDACDGAGRCAGVPMAPGSPCDDRQGCTLNDTCVQDPAIGLTCRGTPRACNDGNACTNDSCDPATGQCVTTPVNCDDGNECTADSCSSLQGCQHVDRGGTPCNDFNPCTDLDQLHCVDNHLICSGLLPRDCNDDRGCTIDTCVPSAGGCQHIENCDDHNPCT